MDTKVQTSSLFQEASASQYFFNNHQDSQPEIKLVQINLNNFRATNLHLLKYMHENSIDIAIVQEEEEDCFSFLLSFKN